MKVQRKIIQINESLCDGCGDCIPSCAEGAIEIREGKARLVAEKYCDGLGACLGECPHGALTIAERAVDEFDEEAVEQHLRSNKENPAPQTLACGCPSSQIQSFGPMQSCREANEPITQRVVSSQLSHWPIQIRLVPVKASFLKGADLLVASDCTTVAAPHFHRDFLKGRVVLMGCPKFDDVQEYIHKFADIFSTAGIKSMTILVMDVPCCQGMPHIVEKGMKKAGKSFPIEKIVIGVQGEVLTRERLAA
jgi:Pyruvate/2-oxoacid:ferredoxin oxidoreductase delta subunit